MEELPKWHPDAKPDDAKDRIPMYFNGKQYNVHMDDIKSMRKEGMTFSIDGKDENTPEISENQDIAIQSRPVQSEVPIDNETALIQSMNNSGTTFGGELSSNQFVKGALSASVGKLADTAIAAGHGAIGKTAEVVGNLTNDEELKEVGTDFKESAGKFWNEGVVEKRLQGEAPQGKLEEMSNEAGKTIGLVLPFNTAAKGIRYGAELVSKTGAKTIPKWMNKINKLIETPVNWATISTLGIGGAAAEGVRSDDNSDAENLLSGFAAFMLAGTVVNKTSKSIMQSISNDTLNIKNEIPKSTDKFNWLEKYLMKKVVKGRTDLDVVASDMLGSDLTVMAMFKDKEKTLHVASVYPHVAYSNAIRNMNEDVSRRVSTILTDTLGGADRPKTSKMVTELRSMYLNIKEHVDVKVEESFEQLHELMADGDFVDGKLIAKEAEYLHKFFYSPTKKFDEKGGAVLLNSLEAIATEFASERIPLNVAITQYRDINRVFRDAVPEKNPTRHLISLNSAIFDAMAKGNIKNKDRVIETFKRSNLEYKNFEIPLVELELTNLMVSGDRPHRTYEMLGTEEGIQAFDRAINTLSDVAEDFLGKNTEEIQKIAGKLKRNKLQQILVDNIRASSEYRPGRFVDVLKGENALVIEQLATPEVYKNLTENVEPIANIAVNIDTALKRSRTVVGLDTDAEKSEKIISYVRRNLAYQGVGGFLGYIAGGEGLTQIAASITGVVAGMYVQKLVTSTYAKILTEPKYTKYIIDNFYNNKSNNLYKKIDKVAVPILTMDLYNAYLNQIEDKK